MNAKYFQLKGFSFTDAAIENEWGEFDVVVSSNDKKYRTAIRWDRIEILQEQWDSCKEKFLTLIYNRIDLNNIIFVNHDMLNGFIENHYINYSPEQKSYNLLKYIKSISSFDGERVSKIAFDPADQEIWRKFYFTNNAEMYFYLNDLVSVGLLNKDNVTMDGFDIKITKEGLVFLRNHFETNDSKT